MGKTESLIEKYPFRDLLILVRTRRMSSSSPGSLELIRSNHSLWMPNKLASYGSPMIFLLDGDLSLWDIVQIDIRMVGAFKGRLFKSLHKPRETDLIRRIVRSGAVVL
jgi:hypothetical protein